jgi:integrase
MEGLRMATIVREKTRGTDKHNGRRRVEWFNGDGKRLTVRLGKMTEKGANEIKSKVEAILQAATAQISWDRETAKWVADLEADLHDKFAAKGLLPPRAAKEKSTSGMTLGTFLDDVISDRKATVGASTVEVDNQAKDLLVEKFGRDKLLTEFSEGDSDKWRIWLGRSKDDGGRGLAPNTVRKRCAIAKRMFKSAVRQRFIGSNPFEVVEGGTTVRANKSREYFVTREETQKLLDNASNDEFRLIIALCRYGALRCPSELIDLRWSDFNWDLERMTVRSPKTAHHEGGGERVVPLFPELREHVDKVYFADNDAEFVLDRYRRPDVNLRSCLQKCIRRAGLAAWPKLFQNMRQSRATELASEFPAHVAAAWCGHSVAVAKEHYWRATDADFDRALGKKAQQNAQHQTAKPSKTKRSREGKLPRNPR